MFEKTYITVNDIMAMDLPNIILYAAPVMFLLVGLEWGWSLYRQHKVYDGKDFLAATTIGLINVGLSAIVKIALFTIVLFCYNLVPWSIPPTWWSYILCFFLVDFLRYVAHRVAHEQRMWWATHVTHHNSKQYNFSVSFRLGWTQHIKLIFFLPVAFAGFHPVVFFICHQIAVLYQFWIHTEYIKKLPRPIEFFFTTPSHHRVHHGTNEKYIDKNYGSTFIIWDRIFGTFEPEAERPNYGITEELNTYNPVTLVFHEWRDLVRDMRYVKNFREGLLVLFGKPADTKNLKERTVKKIKEPA